MGFEPTVVLRHLVNSQDFSASKATCPFVVQMGFEPTFDVIARYRYKCDVYKTPLLLHEFVATTGVAPAYPLNTALTLHGDNFLLFQHPVERSYSLIVCFVRSISLDPY